MTASVSTIQIWTLIVAGLAVVASIGGTFYNAKNASKSEHDVWQRDLRVRIYAECTSTAESYIALLTAYAGNVHATMRTQANRETKEIGHIAQVRQLRLDLRSAVDEAVTFGANKVAESAAYLYMAVIDSSDTIVAEVLPDLVSMREALEPARQALGEFRMAVRESLKVSEV